MIETSRLHETHPELPHHSRLYRVLAASLVVAKRNLVMVPRIPELLVFLTLQPIMFVLLFRYILAGAIEPGGGTSYVYFLMAGIFVQTVAFGAISTGIDLALDLQKGLVNRFRSLPMARSAVLTGRILADLVRNMFIVGVMLAVGLLVGFRPEAGVAGWAGAVGLLLLLSFTFSWIAATFGILVRNPEAVQSGSLLLLFPLAFASSTFVPTRTMPGWLQVFAEHQPITQIVDAVRGLLLDQDVDTAGWQALAWCVGVTVISAPISV